MNTINNHLNEPFIIDIKCMLEQHVSTETTVIKNSDDLTNSFCFLDFGLAHKVHFPLLFH